MVAVVPAEVAGEAVDEAVDKQGKARVKERVKDRGKAKVDNTTPGRQLIAVPVRCFMLLTIHRLLPPCSLAMPCRLEAQTMYRANVVHLRVPHTGLVLGRWNRWTCILRTRRSTVRTMSMKWTPLLLPDLLAKAMVLTQKR